MIRLVLLLAFIFAAGCVPPLPRVRVVPRARSSSSQPAALSSTPVAAPVQSGAVNATVGAATGIQSGGDVAGIRVESVAPWGTIVLLGVVLVTALVLSHRREVLRIKARCNGGDHV